MARKTTSIYKVDITLPGLSRHTYYYGRNSRTVRREVNEQFPEATYVHITKVGDCKFTLIEPVCEFTAEEKKQIEDYYFRKMIEFEAFKGKIAPSSAV